MAITERTAHWSLVVIAVVLTFGALYATRDIVAPIVLALVAGVVLSPVTETLDKLGLPHPFAAFCSFLSGIVVIVLIVLLCQPIVTRTIDALPVIWREVNSAMYTVKGEFRSLKEMSEEFRAAIDPSAEAVDGNPANAVKRPSDQAAQENVDTSAIPSVEDVIVMAPAIAGQILIFVGALFFFILTRKEIYEKLATRLAHSGYQHEAALRLRHAERQVARYFITISLINIGLGACVGLGMMAIGMPSPIIWGGLAFLLNYFLYVGPGIFTVILIVAGVVVYDGGQVVLPVAVYLTMNMIEAQFVTPTLVGRTLSVNPLLVFLALVLFMWLWGPIGAIVSIPLLVWGLVLTADIRDIRRVEADRLAAQSDAEPA